MVHPNKQKMVVDARISEEIVRLAGNRIGMRAPSSRHKIGDAAVLVTLVVVDVAIEHDEAGSRVLLPFLEEFRESLFLGPRRVSSSVIFFIRRTGIRWMMEDKEDEVDIRGDLVELGA